MNVARRPIWLLLLVTTCAIASVMGLATSAHLASSFSSPSATPGGATPVAGLATPATPVATLVMGLDIPAFPSKSITSDIDRIGSDIAKHAPPGVIPLTSKRVYDTGSILNDEREKMLEGDARVLASYGIPVLVFARRSTDTVAESQVFADNLRSQRNVESAPGADDGLVMLLTVSTQFPYRGEVVISTGEQTLPVQGLDQEKFDQIYRDDIVPNLRQGKNFDALNISLRHMTYNAQFVPGPVPATSLRQDKMASLLSVIAPLGAALLGLLIEIQWLIPTAKFRHAGVSRRHVNKGLIAGGLGFATILTVLAVYSRSSIGSGYAVLSFAILAANGLFGRDRVNGIRNSRRRMRVLRVHPRLTFRRHPAPVASPHPSNGVSIPARRRHQ